MKTAKLLLTASIAIASAAAMAATQEGNVGPDAAAGGASRAQVQSELAAYQHARVNPWATSYNPAKYFRGERTRADVTAEFLASRGQVAAMTGEDSGSSYLTQLAARKVRTDANFAGQPVNSAK